jgi:hypothetical protein
LEKNSIYIFPSINLAYVFFFDIIRYQDQKLRSLERDERESGFIVILESILNSAEVHTRDSV